MINPKIRSSILFYLKIIIWSLIAVIIIMIGIGLYYYQTRPMIKAIIYNDESELFYFPSKEIERMGNLAFTEYKLNVEDTIYIYSYYFEPKATEKRGDIFFLHGASGNVSKYKEFFKPLLQGGYGVYAVDWRGYGLSNGHPDYMGVLKDSQRAFNHFYDKVKDDNLDILVYGVSLGGQLATKIVRDNPERVDALILDGSIASAQLIAMDFAPLKFLKKRALESPEKFNQQYVAERDISEITDIPKLIIHSHKDTEVQLYHGQRLYEAAKEPKFFWETDTPHIMTLLEYPDITLNKINGLVK